MSPHRIPAAAWRARLRTILVPHDLTDHSTCALRLGAELAAGLSGTLHLAHATAASAVVWSSAEPVWLAGVADLTEEARARARSALREIVQRERVSARLHIVIGPPARAICALAREIDADLIVTASRRRSVLDEILLGGVGPYALRHAPCPVLSVPAADGVGAEGCAASSR